MGRSSIFTMGISNELFRRGTPVGPTFLSVTKDEIEAGGYALLRHPPVPKGWVGTYPYIVKVNTTGEYIVYADGTAQYMDYTSGEISDPIDIRGY